MHDVEGEVALLEEIAPVADHGRQHLAVLVAAIGVLFALVPERAGDRQGRQRRQHSVVEHAGHHRPVFITDRQRLRRPRVHGNLGLPASRQRDGLVADGHAQVLRLAHEAAVGQRFQHADGDDVLARLQHSGTDEVLSWVLHPRAAADLLPVDVNRVHLLDDAEQDHVAACRHRVGNVELFAEVDQRGGIRHAELREAARNCDLFPAGVVIVRRGPVLLHANVVIVIPVHDEVAVFGARVLRCDALRLRDGNVEVVQRPEGGDAGPGLSRSAADGVDDQTDGNVRLLLHAAGEVERHRGPRFPASPRSRSRRRCSPGDRPSAGPP